MSTNQYDEALAQREQRPIFDQRAVGRGVLLETTYFCENGHTYRKSWQVHQGETLISLEDLGCTAPNPKAAWRG